MQEFRPPPKSPVRWPCQLTPKNGGRKGYTVFVALASSRRFAKAKPETASAALAAFAFLRWDQRRSNGSRSFSWVNQQQAQNRLSGLSGLCVPSSIINARIA